MKRTMKFQTCILVGLAVTWLGGCTVPPAVTPTTTNTGQPRPSFHRKFVAHGLSRDWVHCVALEETALDNGRLRVRANLRNRLGHRVRVQVGCVFTNENGFAAGDKTLYEWHNLDPGELRPVSFDSLSEAQDYTVQVRDSR